MGNIITASLLLLLAIVVATGKLDCIFVNYGPGYVNGKFKWLKRTRYKARPSRYLLIALLLLVAALLLVVELLNLDTLVSAIAIAVLCVAVAVVSFRLKECE